MLYKKTKDGKFILRTATLADAAQMEEVQRICFPTLADHERLTKEHFANHLRVFPEGQLVVTDHDRVIASSSTLRVPFPALDHTFMEITDHLWITNTHSIDGEWLYQLDIGILPAYRGLRLSTELYNAQQELVASLGMKGQVLVGMTIGYDRYKDRYSIEEYCEKLKNNELTDPTVTPQRRAGFQWIQPIFNYLEDPTAGNCSILMAWPLEGVSLQEVIDRRTNASPKN
jgi:ribosomal protein S18 acetylase RimI-like enzyme